jgi:hypothetical protein
MDDMCRALEAAAGKPVEPPEVPELSGEDEYAPTSENGAAVFRALRSEYARA